MVRPDFSELLALRRSLRSIRPSLKVDANRTERQFYRGTPSLAIHMLYFVDDLVTVIRRGA